MRLRKFFYQWASLVWSTELFTIPQLNSENGFSLDSEESEKKKIKLKRCFKWVNFTKLFFSSPTRGFNVKHLNLLIIIVFLCAKRKITSTSLSKLSIHCAHQIEYKVESSFVTDCRLFRIPSRPQRVIQAKHVEDINKRRFMTTRFMCRKPENLFSFHEQTIDASFTER